MSSSELMLLPVSFFCFFAAAVAVPWSAEVEEDGSRPLRRRRRVRLGLWTENGVESTDRAPSEGSSSEAEADDVEEVDDDRSSSGLTVMHVVRVYTVSVGKDRMPSVAEPLLVLASLELVAWG